jgi:hypothetical protein
MRVQGREGRLRHGGQIDGLQAVAAARKKRCGAWLETLSTVARQSKTVDHRIHTTAPVEARHQRRLLPLCARACDPPTAQPRGPATSHGTEREKQHTKTPWSALWQARERVRTARHNEAVGAMLAVHVFFKPIQVFVVQQATVTPTVGLRFVT